MESQISRRHLSGLNEPRNSVMLTLKPNWDDAIRTAMASSETILSLPVGIEKRRNMFPIWAEQDRDEIIWAISIWKVWEFQVITFRLTCGFL
jgi:hypothetical protein